MEFPPYDGREARLKVLADLNALLPASEALQPDRADRKPGIPLAALRDPAQLAALKSTLGRLITTLRAAP